jgi:hypothetical protein
MQLPGADIDSRIDVEVDSLATFAARLHAMVSMIGRAQAAAYGARSSDFTGSGPPAALLLRDVNAAGLRDLANAVERLDRSVCRLRDAADYLATAYARTDAFAASTTRDVSIAWDRAGAGRGNG